MKDCAEINDRYRKLMKEESELLNDLKKLQTKKQMLVRRSKQLRDEQVIKLNLDLQKEKASRGELERKLGGLEKKLAQLEKEIDARNRDKQLSKNRSSDSAKKPHGSESKSNRLKEGTEKSKALLSDSKDWLVSKKSKSSLRTEEPKSGTEAVKQSSPIQAANQINAKQNQPKTGAIIPTFEDWLKNTTNLQTKTDFQLAKKTVNTSFELTAKTNFVGPVLPKTINTETNTEPIEVTDAQTASSVPKEQQIIRRNVNNLIRLIAGQNNATTRSPSEPTSQPDSNPAVSQPKTSTASDSLSNSSTNVNYSPSSSSNNSIMEDV